MNDKAAPIIMRPAGGRAWRKWWLKIHLYLGLFIGALLLVFGTTGAMLVFWIEIDEWLNPELRTVIAPALDKAAFQPLHKIMRAAEQVAAPNSKFTTVYGSLSREGVFAVYASQPSGNWQRIFVNPYLAQATGVRNYRVNEWIPDYLMDAIFSLHYALLMGENGIILAAICALFLIISLITGLIVWWPANGQWSKAFTIKRNASRVRLNFDLHKTFSLYFFPVLGAVLLSGVYMNLNDPFIWMTQHFSATTRGSPQLLESFPIPGIPPMDVERAWSLATKHYPEGEFNSISLPETITGVYVISQRNVPRLSSYWSERLITIDQYSGKILDVRAPNARRSAGETFLDWQWPLHTGKAFGWFGRILVLLCGLACSVIYITGVIRWLQKRGVQK
ncbi:MAG: putative iron-regulated membrane protein [Candidatus Nitrotoga sp. SPKER]|nr:MAG: putative iron-regulated membrane protein [Candidatus Nitrotoga sp. SPKER]